MYIKEARTISVEKEVITSAKCDKCGGTLEPVGEFHGEPWGWQGALRITVSGGYGEYLDGSAEVIVCNICANELRQWVPIINMAIEKALE